MLRLVNTAPCCKWGTMRNNSHRLRLPLALLSTTLLVGGGLTVASTAAQAAGNTLNVCQVAAPEECAYSSIQAAVNAAESGDIINVGAGTYKESVLIDKPLTLVGPTEISPNGSDPLTRVDRGAEAVIAPPAGATNHGITLTAVATDVTVSGFTVDLSNGVQNQRHLNVNTAIPSLTISQNVFTNGIAAASGSMSIYGPLGDAELVFIENRIEDSGASNGLQVYNSGSSQTSVRITDNVWLNNRGLAMNLASKDGSITGQVSDNWIGNSTPGESGVDNFGKRQGGMVLANAFSGLSVTNNTLMNIEDAAVSFWNSFSGTAEISGNLISGYSNVPGYAAVYVRPQDGVVGDFSNLKFENNSFENPTAGSRALLNQPDAATFDATLNWWGSATPDFTSLVSGDVTTKPYYVNSERTETSTKATSASLTASSPMLVGADEKITATVTPNDAAGTLEIYVNDALLKSGNASDGPVVASLSHLKEGTYTFHALFTPADVLDFTESISDSVVVQINAKQVPSPPPAESSDQLDKLIENEGLDVPATTAGFTIPSGSANSNLGNLNPEEPLVGELPWPNTADSFVDVYSYSTPVFLGTFPVVNGVVQLSADISALPAGQHRLLFVGQTSGQVQVMQITLQADGAASAPQPATQPAQLTATGADSFIVPLGLGTLALLLGLGLVATVAIRNRVRQSTE
jgi:hypothetical protein